MATIDYKEKYMQALERARQFSEKPYLEDSAGIVEYIFPELKESEDVIRKELISFLKSPFVNENITDEKVAPWIAWLEKQEIKEDAERKELRKIELEPTEGWYDFIRWFVKQRTDDYTLIPSDDDIHKWGDNILNHARKVLEKSPSWSEEDQEMLNQVIEDIVKLAGPYVCYHKDVDWLKSIKYRIQPQLEQDFTDDDKEQIKKISEAINNYYPCNESSEMRIWLNSIKDRIEWLKSIISRQQPKQEWSEEDDRIYNRIVSFIPQHLTAESYTACINWLKSLKDRVQPQPKQEWSEYDNEMFLHCCGAIRVADYSSCEDREKLESWLRNLKDRVQLQSKQEWSEEDDRMYNRIVSFIPQHLTAESYTACINWLKSLRPQNRWKPSNDIIMYLERAIEEESRPKDFQMALNNLLEQLKKLREE